MYRDTTGYFAGSEFKKFLTHTSIKDRFKNVLEIGTYEGIFSCFAADNFAEKIISVDPFNINDPGTKMTSQTEANFFYNLSICKRREKISLKKMTSSEFFLNNSEKFDLIYVDGSHEPDEAYCDVDSAFKACKSGGLIWVDDFDNSYKGVKNDKSLKEKFQQWMNENSESIVIIHTGYQVGFIKK